LIMTTTETAAAPPFPLGMLPDGPLCVLLRPALA